MMSMNNGGAGGRFGLAVVRQLMSRWPTMGSIAVVVVGGGLVCWLYVAEVARNLETSKAAATVGIEQASAVRQNDRGEINKPAADLPSAIAALKQGLHELAAGLDQVKQELQQERDKSDEQAQKLAVDLGHTQQSAQRETEQARRLTEEFATKFEQVRQALQQQSERAEKLELPMRLPKKGLAAQEQEGERDGRLSAVTSDVAQLNQAFGALATDLDKVMQALL